MNYIKDRCLEMVKLKYIIKQLSKTNKKNYENYVVTRIWHKLNDLDYKFVTQQYVIRPNGKHALTDMYFPQLGIHVEVDEGYHKDNVESDKVREYDIVSITGHKVFRVDVTKSIIEVNKDIEFIVQEIKNKRNELGPDFEAWDPIKEISSQTYIDKGYIDLSDNVAFDRIVDAINCFGVQYNGWQRGGITHPKEKDVLIWFPKLYPNELWINSISDDEKVIYEKPAIPEKVDSHISEVIEKRHHKRIVFARVIDSLGNIQYKFKGMYNLDIQETRSRRELIWKRVGTRVKTYIPMTGEQN